MNKPVSGLYAITPELTDSIALFSKVDAALVDTWPTLFAYQYVFELAPPATPIS